MKDDIAHRAQTSLASLIGSRICHDLINPIGAISNGLELVTMVAPDMSGPEMSLIQQSCENATARIRFFRIAFGSAMDGRPIPAEEARQTLRDHYTGTRVTPVWSPVDPLPRFVVQIAYLGAMCAETALKQGGRVTIDLTEDTLQVTAEGTSVIQDAPLWEVLSTAQETELQPAEVQFGLLREVCEVTGTGLEAVFSETEVQMSFALSNRPAS